MLPNEATIRSRNGQACFFEDQTNTPIEWLIMPERWA